MAKRLSAPIDFTHNLHDTRAISAIAERAWSYVNDFYRHKLELTMDITAAHKACPLDLDAMSTTADIGQMLHDVCGIYRHLDRDTGKLTGCFLPRFAKHQ